MNAASPTSGRVPPPLSSDEDEVGESARWLSGTRGYSLAFVALFLLIYFAPSMVVLIPAGHAGVLYRPFQGGTYLDGNVREGLTLISPFNNVTAYDLRLQESEEKIDVLSSNGLTIDVTVSFRFKPDAAKLPHLHVLIGPDYERKVIVPTVIAVVREVVGKYRPEELYTTHRNTVQEEMNRDVRAALQDKHIVFEAILVRGIRLPELINTAIEKKLRQQQEYQEYEYRLLREVQEKERKLIEAEGWREFQARVSENLTPEFLRWKWIDAMLLLSASNNAKVVVLGEGGKDGAVAPVVLPLSVSEGGGDGAAGRASAVARAGTDAGNAVPTRPSPLPDRNPLSAVASEAAVDDVPPSASRRSATPNDPRARLEALRELGRPGLGAPGAPEGDPAAGAGGAIDPLGRLEVLREAARMGGTGAPEPRR